MKKTLLSLLVLLALAMPVHAQFGNTTTIRFTGAPTGSCAPLSLGINNATGAMYDCVAGVWTLVGGGGGGSIGGSIANTQVAVGSGVNTISGSSALTYTGTLNVTAASMVNGVDIVVPTDDGLNLFLTNTSAPATSGLGLNIDNSGAGFVSNSDGTHLPFLQFTNTGRILAQPDAADRVFAVAGASTTTGTVSSGTDNSAAGSFIAANSAANAHTVWGSGATTTNTINGFATVPTTGHIVTCTVATTVCTLTDGGAVPTGTVTSIATTSPITGGTITGTGTIACATCTVTVASGAKALATSAISSGACSTAQTDTATGTATTDNIEADFNADPTGVTGYAPVTTGMLTIIKYPTANTVNFKVCNLTALSITPGAVTLNWRVVR